MSKGKFEIEMFVTVKNDDFASSIGDKKSADKKLVKDEGLEKITEVEDTKKLADHIAVPVFTNMLMAVPEIFVGVTIGFVSFISDLVRRIFDKEESTNTDIGLTEENFTGLAEPGQFEVLPKELITDSDLNVEVFTPDEIGTPDININDVGMDFKVDTVFGSNADEVVAHLEEINKQSISEPVKEWKLEFDDAATMEKEIVETKLTGPVEELNKTLATTYRNKVKVDGVKEEILKYRKKIKDRKSRMNKNPLDMLVDTTVNFGIQPTTNSGSFSTINNSKDGNKQSSQYNFFNNVGKSEKTR